MENLYQLLAFLFFGSIIAYCDYCYLIEGYKGLFKGEMNLKVKKAWSDQYIKGVYARLWGMFYLFLGVIITSAYIFFLYKLFSSSGILFILLSFFGTRIIIKKRFTLGRLGDYKGKKAVVMGLFVILVGLGFLLELFI